VVIKLYEHLDEIEFASKPLSPQKRHRTVI